MKKLIRQRPTPLGHTSNWKPKIKVKVELKHLLKQKPNQLSGNSYHCCDSFAEAADFKLSRWC